MNLTEAIWRYQYDHDRGLPARIRMAMNLDDIAYRRRCGVPADPEAAVAMRCLRLLAVPLSVIPGELARHGVDPYRDDPARVFEEYAEPIRQGTGIVLTARNYEQHADALRDYLGPAYPPLFAAYQRLIGIRPTVRQLLAAKVVDEHWRMLEAALEQALSTFELKQALTEREAVRLLNKSLRASCRLTLRFARRAAPAAPYVEPAYYGATYAIFGTAAVRSERFSRGQYRLLERIKCVVDEDAAEHRFDDYDVDARGGYRIKPRYVAKRLGLTEERLSAALHGVRRMIAAGAAE